VYHRAGQLATERFCAARVPSTGPTCHCLVKVTVTRRVPVTVTVTVPGKGTVTGKGKGTVTVTVPGTGTGTARERLWRPGFESLVASMAPGLFRCKHH